MANTDSIAVKDLILDLRNFRTVPQADELHAIESLIEINPDYFWALMESLIDDGYLPTENILVLKEDGTAPSLIVKEGNRRIAALKLIHGYVTLTTHSLPTNISEKIKNLPQKWKTENANVPCAVYAQTDEAIVDRIVTLTHGIGEKAGRLKWEALARARQNRDINGSNEPALELLEKYLTSGKNITAHQVGLWAGDYNLTVLDEAIKKLAGCFNATSAPDLSKKYPAIQDKEILDKIIHDIGLKEIATRDLRGNSGIFTKYGLSQPASTAKAKATTTQSGASGNPSGTNGQPQNTQATPSSTGQVQTQQANSSISTAVKAAVALDDPRSVKRALKNLKINGQNRDKVVTLRNEALSLDLVKNPIAFCFILRSMFEISAKAY